MEYDIYGGCQINVLTEIDLDKSYALYFDRLYSSPAGCTGIEADAVIYAIRDAEGATMIFAKPYLKGTVAFSGSDIYTPPKPKITIYTWNLCKICWKMYVTIHFSLVNDKIDFSLAIAG